MPKYQQQFGIRFEPNLSILDLLFNLGPHSIAYLNNLPLLNLLTEK
jgi:WbqC-like protein family